jgi:hypothetical protein
VTIPEFASDCNDQPHIHIFRNCEVVTGKSDLARLGRWVIDGFEQLMIFQFSSVEAEFIGHDPE